jgi:WD40 repeat protein
MSSVKRIICLANSWKLKERCIAGIDIDTGKWVRPVCDSLYPEDGRVPKNICLVDGREPELLDILEIPLADTGNNFDFESENLSVLRGQWKILGKFKVQDVIKYCDDGVILHNSSKFVNLEYLQALPLNRRKTLQLINAVSLSIKPKTTSRGVTQLRGEVVTISGRSLADIPITDPTFIRKIESGYQPNGNYLITMSLGMPYKPDNWEGDETPCWKLIAGVIELPKNQLTSYKTEVETDNLLTTEANKLKLSLYKVGKLNASSPMISISENQNLIALSFDRDLVLVKCWNTQTYSKYACDVELINLPIYSRVFEVNRVDELFFSPDGQLLGILNLENGEVQCWSIVNNQLLYKFTDSDLVNIRTVYEGDEEEGISDTVVITTYIIFFSSEKNIIVCSDFGVKAWKYGKLLYSIPQYRVTSDDMTREMKEIIAFNNDRDIFAFTDNKSQTTSLINLKSGQLITTLKNDSTEICQATLSHDASLLVLLEKNETLKLYNLSSNKYLKSLSILEGYKILDVQISPDLNHIAVISAKAGNGTGSVRWGGAKALLCLC